MNSCEACSWDDYLNKDTTDLSAVHPPALSHACCQMEASPYWKYHNKYENVCTSCGIKICIQHMAKIAGKPYCFQMAGYSEDGCYAYEKRRICRQIEWGSDEDF